MCVLLVGDESLIREIMTEYLQDAGYEVVDVENGQRAIEKLRAPPKSFSVLVTDFHIPGNLDGSDVARYVREAFPGIPVIIASGRPDIPILRHWRPFSEEPVSMRMQFIRSRTELFPQHIPGQLMQGMQS